MKTNPTTSDHARSNPRVSIIIATFNAAETLEECIDSIVGQSFPAWEIIVFDNVSTDGTQEILASRETHIAHWQSAPDSGIYDAWNRALAHARGEYVLFLGADDSLHSPGTLERVFDEIGSQEFDLVTGRGELVSENGVGYHVFGKPWDFRAVMRRITICHPGALHRRTLFEDYGQFDTSYRICADYDFLLRLPSDTRALFIDSALTRVRDSGVSRNRRLKTLRESFRAQASCPRIGRVRAAFNFLDKAWRIPVAKLFGIPN